jgi:hypothetical protein
MSRVMAGIAHKIRDRPPLRRSVGQQARSVSATPSGRHSCSLPHSTGGAGHQTGTCRLRRSAVVKTAYHMAELPNVGDVLDVLAEDLENGWPWRRSSNGREGWVPAKRLTASG